METKLAGLAEELATICLERSVKIVTAESCTGGGVAFELTKVPGSSKWFERGFITYTNTAKIEMLGIDPDTLHHYGAVSEQVAKQMAEGALLNSHASASIAITGIAGPSGGSETKPVGTVWFGWASASFKKTHTSHMLFPGDRQEIRQQAIAYALQEFVALLQPRS